MSIQTEGSEIEYLDVEDGEFLQLTQLEYGEETDTILMTREVALMLADKIRELYSNVGEDELCH